MTLVQSIIALGAWGQQHATTMLVVLVALPVGLALVSWAMRGRRGPSEVMGSARWATKREVRQLGLLGTAGVVIGRLQGTLVCDNTETHMLLMGPTRSGKGLGTLGPTLRRTWRDSVLVYDPKDGENYDLSYAHRRAMGQDVAFFCPYKAPQACINVMDTIRYGQPEESRDADCIAYSLTAPVKMKQESMTSLHFRNLSRMLLKAVLLHVGYIARRKSLAGCWYFMTQHYANLPACLAAMQTTAHTSHGVHEAIASLTQAIGNITGERELGSIWSTAIQPLEPYSDYYVAASTDMSTIDLDALQYGPTPLSLYLAAPSPSDLVSMHPIYRVIVDVALHRLQQHKVRTWDHRLLVCGDELPQYGYSKTIEKDIAVVAGYGIKMLIVAQDLPMLEDAYGANNGVWGNTNLKIFHTPTNDATAKRLSENLMGKGTIDHAVASQQNGIMGHRSVSFQHVARPLLTTDEVMELPAYLEIVRVSGCKPILCEKVNYRFDSSFQCKDCI